jgi:multidrug efflux pump subunit AcrB
MYTDQRGTEKPLEVSFDTGGMVSTALNYGANSPMEIQIEGGSQQDAYALAEEIRDRIGKVRGAADAHVVQRLDAPYMVIEVDRAAANLVGLDTYGVMMQVVAAINSSISIDRNFWIDNKTGNQYFVAVQYPEDPHRKLEDLLNIPARTANHGEVRLSSLVHLHPSTGAVEVNHVALYRIFSVELNTENRDLAGVAHDVDVEIGEIRKAAEARGMHIDFKGEYQQMNDSFQKLLGGLAGAALLVYLLQVALFRSFAGPFVIMFTVPLGLIGVLAILFFTHTTLNVQSEMGVIFLVGIAVNNGVLMVDFANQQRKLGASVPKAIRTAASIRFRPIIMTFLATFLDLIPMAIGMGRGSEANIPLARAVVGGLLTSTCLTLFVLPIMYTLLIRDKPFEELDIDQILADESWRENPPAGEDNAAQA